MYFDFDNTKLNLDLKCFISLTAKHVLTVLSFNLEKHETFYVSKTVTTQTSTKMLYFQNKVSYSVIIRDRHTFWYRSLIFQRYSLFYKPIILMSHNANTCRLTCIAGMNNQFVRRYVLSAFSSIAANYHQASFIIRCFQLVPSSLKPGIVWEYCWQTKACRYVFTSSCSILLYLMVSYFEHQTTQYYGQQMTFSVVQFVLCLQ